MRTGGLLGRAGPRSVWHRFDQAGDRGRGDYSSQLKPRGTPQGAMLRFGPLSAARAEDEHLEVEHLAPRRRIAGRENMLDDQQPATLPHRFTTLAEDRHGAVVILAVN